MLSVRDVSCAFGLHVVLRGINLNVATGEIVCLLGPSGCGKTTLLRIIAGLEQSSSGDVLFNGNSILATPVHRRGFGLMFQDFALFPHMNVAENIAFGLKMQHAPASVQQARVKEALDRVNLPGFEKRDVAQLSGGERQRVALARSLAPNPQFLMLDEPLGSLDAALRDELIVELRTIIKQLGLTALYVTHDQREAFAIADRIAVMNQGQIEQIDLPHRVYGQPATPFVARFLGLNNFAPVLHQENGTASTSLGRFTVDQPAHVLLLHPDGIHLADEHTTSPIAAVVKEVVFQGDTYRVRVQHESGLQLQFKHAANAASVPQIHQTVHLEIAPSAVIPLPR